MGRLRRTMRMERLESRSLLAAALGIADLVVDQTTDEPQVATSIEINNAAGIRAATVEILYDQNLLQADLASVRAGSIWEGKGVAIANRSDQDGKITAFIFATEDMNLSSGTLLDIDFMFNDGSPADARAHVGLGSVRLNEGDIPVSPVPMPGHKTIDGSITRQAGSALPDTSVTADSPLRPSSPQKPTQPTPAAGTIPGARPQMSAPQRQPSPNPIAAPTAPARANTPQDLPRQNGPLTSDAQPPASEPHGGLHCAPRSGAAPQTAGDTAAEPLRPLVESPSSGSALALVKYSVDMPGPRTIADDQPVGEPLAEAPSLPAAMIEKSVSTADRPAAELTDAQLAPRAKPTLEAGHEVRRSPPPLKTFSLFVGSPHSSRAGGLRESLLWLLSHREAAEPQRTAEQDRY